MSKKTDKGGALNAPPTVKKENIMLAKQYPLYMYHMDYDEPLRVDNKDEERQLIEKGYVDCYIHKEYPKWVSGAIVKNKAEHEARLAMFPEVVKGTPLQEDTIEETLSKVEPIRRVGRPPLKG